MLLALDPVLRSQFNPGYAGEDDSYCTGASSYPGLVYKSSSPEFEEKLG